MMSLDRRLCRLESVSGCCSECGVEAAGRDAGGEYEVVWDDTEEAGERGPEFCGACGRQTAFVVGWADLEEMGPDGIPGEAGS